MAGGMAAKAKRHDEDWYYAHDQAGQAENVIKSLLKKLKDEDHALQVGESESSGMLKTKESRKSGRGSEEWPSSDGLASVENKSGDGVAAGGGKNATATYSPRDMVLLKASPPSAPTSSSTSLEGHDAEVFPPPHTQDFGSSDFALQSILRSERVLTTCRVVREQLREAAEKLVLAEKQGHQGHQHQAKSTINQAFRHHESCVSWDEYRMCGGPIRLPVEGYPSELILMGVGVGRVVDLLAPAGKTKTKTNTKYLLEFAIRTVNGNAQLSIETPSRCELVYGAGYHRAWLEHTPCSVLKHESFVNEVQMRRFF
eukprot:g11299.t1